MTYEEFAKKQKEILDKAGEYLKNYDLFNFNKIMDEFNLLADRYLEQRKGRK